MNDDLMPDWEGVTVICVPVNETSELCCNISCCAAEVTVSKSYVLNWSCRASCEEQKSYHRLELSSSG
jgi:hypothetical protein